MFPLLLISLLAQTPGHERTIAPSWTAAESANYQASVDRKVAHGGHSSLTLKATGGDSQGYAVRQRFRADSWRGKRMKFSGWLKTDHVESGGGAIWLRIDMANGDYILDAMLERKGQDWTRIEILAAVPEDAVGITFGARMLGKGQIWADDFAFEPGLPRIPTGTIERRKGKGANPVDEFQGAPLGPGNLGLEQ